MSLNSTTTPVAQRAVRASPKTPHMMSVTQATIKTLTHNAFARARDHRGGPVDAPSAQRTVGAGGAEVGRTVPGGSSWTSLTA